MEKRESNRNICMPEPRLVERAIKCSYAQSMVFAVFASATGGAFLTAYALRLGADNRLIAWMSALPQLAVVMRFAGAILVEREISRKKLAVGFGLAMPACWLVIAAMPVLGTDWAREHIGFLAGLDSSRLKSLQFTTLISLLVLAGATGCLAGIARDSWLGELVPEARRGRFFGHMAMFALIVAACVSPFEGRYVDWVKGMGPFAFTALFSFGALFAIANGLLWLPQPDCPLPKGPTRPSMWKIARQMLANRPLMSLAAVQGCYSLTNVAFPFFYLYQMRDVGMNMFWISTISAGYFVTSLVASPFWGRATSRYGYKPVMTLGFSIWGPATILWYWVPPGSGLKGLWIVALTNVIGAVGMSAVSVSIITAVYKTTEPVGRSIQLAFYYAFTVLAGVPMPILGVRAVEWLHARGHDVDLRFTFYAMMAVVIACALLCRRLIEPDAADTATVVRAILGLRHAERRPGRGGGGPVVKE